MSKIDQLSTLHFSSGNEELNNPLKSRKHLCHTLENLQDHFDRNFSNKLTWRTTIREIYNFRVVLR